MTPGRPGQVNGTAHDRVRDHSHAACLLATAVWTWPPLPRGRPRRVELTLRRLVWRQPGAAPSAGRLTSSGRASEPTGGPPPAAPASRHRHRHGTSISLQRRDPRQTEAGHVGVEIDPILALQIQHHLPVEHLVDRHRHGHTATLARPSPARTRVSVTAPATNRSDPTKPTSHLGGCLHVRGRGRVTPRRIGVRLRIW